ncbi:MAG: PadR family transcriptional regulator [Actinobacteria bacterium]|jgi:DNA-binding PadR family transcriptional regulator|nr:MAG: PadR family transcriptional regulator [Actinomycetota bacterium]
MFWRNTHGEGEGAYGGHLHHPRMIHHGRMTGGMPLEFPGPSGDNTRRFLRPVVMLLLAEQPMHGYELMGRLKEFGIGQGGMDPSLLYRLLRFLERAGMAESTLDDSGAGPARKVYNLTPEGMEVLDMWAANLEEVSDLLKKFKGRYDKLTQ